MSKHHNLRGILKCKEAFQPALENKISWTPLFCPWYLPSVRNYVFTISHSNLGHEITTSRASRSGWPIELAVCLGIIETVSLFVLFPEKIYIGIATAILLILAMVCRGAVLMRYRPHFDLPNRLFYRGIERFDCSRGQFDSLPFDRIQTLQIIPTGEKSHCQLIAVLQDDSRKLLMHGNYDAILGLMIYKNVKGKAVFPKKPSPCFLNAIAPIDDCAMFPLPYTPSSEPAESKPYQPPDGVTLVGSDDLATFNHEYTDHGFDEAIRWADAYSKGTGFKPLPLCLVISTLELWPERLSNAGVKTTVRIEDFYECCGRSIEANCCFDGLSLTVEFNGATVCLLCFIKVIFPDSGKIEACFYCENEKLLDVLKHAGLEEEKAQQEER